MSKKKKKKRKKERKKEKKKRIPMVHLKKIFMKKLARVQRRESRNRWPRPIEVFFSLSNQFLKKDLTQIFLLLKKEKSPGWCGSVD